MPIPRLFISNRLTHAIFVNLRLYICLVLVLILLLLLAMISFSKNAFAIAEAKSTPSILVAQSIPQTKTATLDQGDTSFVYPVQLELKVLDSSTKITGSTAIEDRSDTAYTIIETTYNIRARAFGGDLYLPTYREDIIFSPSFAEPADGSNALVAGVPSIELLRPLPQVNNKFLLKEYEEVDIRIKISFKVLPTAMPPRIVFAPRLDTVLWYPTIYENGANDPGIDSDTGERLINIPLVIATYVPQQVTRVDSKAETVTLIKSHKALTSAMKNFRAGGLASIRSIFQQIFSR